MKYIKVESYGIKYNINLNHILFVEEEIGESCIIKLIDGTILHPPVKANDILFAIDAIIRPTRIYD